MKNKGLVIFLISFLSICCILLICFMFMLLSGKNNSFNYFSPISINNGVSSNVAFNEEYEGDYKKIDVSSKAADINIKESDSDKIKVVVYSENNDVTVNDYSSELNIKVDSEGCRGFCFNYKLTKVDVFVPVDYRNKIVIDSEYGDIEVGDFSNTSFDIESSCGDIKLHSGKDINIESDYGDVEIDNAFDVNVKSSCGDIVIDTARNVTAKNDYGNINIERVSNYMNLKNNCGDIEIGEVNIKKDSNIESDFGDIEIESINEIYIDAHTDLGEVNISKNYNRSLITLKIENDCGDIEVKN